MVREVLLNDLIGTIVRDRDGQKVGRIEELLANIELHAEGNDYVVSEFHVGAYGLLEAFTGGAFTRILLQRFGRFARYRQFRIQWDQIDITDPERPRLSISRSELEAVGGSSD